MPQIGVWFHQNPITSPLLDSSDEASDAGSHDVDQPQPIPTSPAGQTPPGPQSQTHPQLGVTQNGQENSIFLFFNDLFFDLTAGLFKRLKVSL